VFVNTIKEWSEQFDNHRWYTVILVLVLTIDEHVGPAWWLQLNLAASSPEATTWSDWMDESHTVCLDWLIQRATGGVPYQQTDSLVRCNLLPPLAANSHGGLATSHFCLQEILRDQDRRTSSLLTHNSTVVNICTVSFLILQKSKFSNKMYFLWFSEKLTVIFLHSVIKLV
jgi:hypothetical protein